MNDYQAPAQQVQRHFRSHAYSFDDLYEDERLLQRLLRPGIFRRRELALEAVRSYQEPRVLDVGCGSGRVGEHILMAGAREWVGVDFAAEMIDLARRRLERFGDRVELICGDFLEVELSGRFEVTVAVGFFDYIADPRPFLAKIRSLCANQGSVVASFPAWTPLKGPIRKIRYELINHCPIFNYTDHQLHELFAEAGFSRLELRPGRAGYLAWARV